VIPICASGLAHAERVLTLFSAVTEPQFIRQGRCEEMNVLIAATRLSTFWSVPYPGNVRPGVPKAGQRQELGVLAKKNLTARELLFESRKSAFALNWSSWKLDGEEPENSPFACGVGIANWPLGSFALSKCQRSGINRSYAKGRLQG